jgi:phosphatidylserine synthase
MKKKIVAAIVLTSWLVLVTIFMLLAESFDLEIFFVLWLIGILIVTELLDAASVHPGSMRYVHIQIAAGVIVFGAIVLQKVMEILA